MEFRTAGDPILFVNNPQGLKFRYKVIRYEGYPHGAGDFQGHREPPDTATLAHIVWTEQIHMAPKGDGRLIVGATVEERGFDDAPILGTTSIPGLALAAGHHRNGYLLAPATALAMEALIADGGLPAVARPFGLDRFDGAAARRQVEYQSGMST